MPQIQSVAAEVEAQLGLVTILVNNAGVADGRRAEKVPHCINVNGIAPGSFRSEMTAKVLAAASDFGETLPHKRLCEPSHYDSALLFLVSPSSEAVTGAVIKVDDGQLGC